MGRGVWDLHSSHWGYSQEALNVTLSVRLLQGINESFDERVLNNKTHINYRSFENQGLQMC